jgi:hypothetical protein
MSETPPEAGEEARRWLGEAHEEVTIADALADNDQLPARAACFHAHLAVQVPIVRGREVGPRRAKDRFQVVRLGSMV